MANDDIDLDRGEPERTSRRRRRERTVADETSPPAGTDFTEAQVRAHLGTAFESLAKNREAREDEELATAIREEGDAMTEGFVALTNAATPLRFPLIIALNVTVVLLAFGRIGTILFYRWTARRAERMQAYDETLENGVPIQNEQ